MHMSDCICHCLITVQGKVVSCYKTSLEDELKLSIGDIVRDIHMTGDKYWTGNLNGKKGYFPKDSVQLLMKGKLALCRQSESI